jgi:hypothetical protein
VTLAKVFTIRSRTRVGAWGLRLLFRVPAVPGDSVNLTVRLKVGW